MTQRRFGDTKKLEILSRIHQLGFKLLLVPDALVFQAAEYKAQYAMSYTDCFALACAIGNSAVLITGDPEFQTVSYLVKIEWILCPQTTRYERKDHTLSAGVFAHCDAALTRWFPWITGAN